MSARAALVVLLAAAACASPQEPHERHEGPAVASRQAIVNGTDSPAEQDAVVLVVHYDALSKDGSLSCSGTLLSPRLVLTARHCVAVTDPSAACGASAQGGVVYANHEAKKLYVFAGNRRPDLLSGATIAARGAEILDDGARTLCNHDVALLVLDQPLAGAKIAPVRFGAGAKKTEKLTLVGWGVTEATSTTDVRKQRTDVEVLAIGPDQILGDAEFMVGEGGCAGDSGGPALAPSGAVVGVLSRGGNGTGEPGAAGCIGGQDVYSSPASFESLILAGYEKVGQAAWREGEPDPTLAKLGEACTADAACQSRACNAQTSTCAQECATAACPSGATCSDQGGRRLCVADAGDEGGCATARAPRSASPFVLLASAFAIALAGRRRYARRR